ncbi:hypothetical protein C8Q74DRAFT_1363564 [Fomes fomentarius]|nr:hypothetical protein C8Q74DRAFT_1363564 [Fomes fomentarius]
MDERTRLWGWRLDGPRDVSEKVYADFFYMHIVTLSVSTLAYLSSARSAVTLAKAYFSMSIGWYLVHCRPSFPIREF